MSQPQLRALAVRTNVRDEIIATLQAAVVSGQLRPGIVYSAPSLAGQFGVSATPVREAMLELVSQGLVETVKNKGFRITELSPAELDELTALRELIEVPTVRAVVERGVPTAVLDQLRTLATAIERAATDGDFVAHHKADLEFHLLLLAQAGNATLVETVRGLRVRSRLYGLTELAHTADSTGRKRLRATMHEHSELVELLAGGGVERADRAADLMRRHLGHVRTDWARDQLGATTEIPGRSP